MVLDWLVTNWRLVVVVLVVMATLTLFLLELFPFEVTALSAVMVLTVVGVLTPQQALSGFSSEATITILMLFIVSAGVVQSGVIEWLEERLKRFMGGGLTLQVAVIVLLVAPVSAFVNNTAAVAVLIPLLTRLAAHGGRSPSKLLIPLSFAAMLGGTLTLIGTSTNLLASSLRRDQGLDAFDMFEFTPVGLVVLGLGALYLVTIGHRLLPERVEAQTIDERFKLREFLFELRVPEESPLIGQEAGKTDLVKEYDVDVLHVLRGSRRTDPQLDKVEYRAGDRLLVRATRKDLQRIVDTGIAELVPVAGKPEWDRDDIAFAELLVGPGSSARGRRLGQVDLWIRMRVHVVALLSRGHPYADRLYHRRLREGDILLVQGAKRDVDALAGGHEFHVLGNPEVPTFRPHKLPIALGVLVAVVSLAAVGLQPIVVTATAGALLMIILGVLRLEEAYSSVRWDVYFLLAGIIPLGIALETTGAALYAAQGFAFVAEYLPPLGLVILVYVFTALLTETVSNNASIVLMAPITFELAARLDYNPTTLLLAAMFAASTSFLTPVGYQTNLLVMGPGGYRFTDFARVGAPLNLILAVATPITINHFFPLV